MTSVSGEGFKLSTMESISQQRRYVAILEQYLAGVRRDIAADQIEQRGLARAVGAEYAERFVHLHMKRDIVGHL